VQSGETNVGVGQSLATHADHGWENVGISIGKIKLEYVQQMLL